MRVTADGLDTTAAVLGPERGLRLVGEYEGAAVLFVRKTDKGTRYLVAFLSSGAQPWQRRSLHALSHFARGIVSVEVC